MSSMNPGMAPAGQHSLRSITLISVVFCIIVAVSLPAITYWLGRDQLESELRVEALTRARYIGLMINQDPQLWPYKRTALVEALDLTLNRGLAYAALRPRVLQPRNRCRKAQTSSSDTLPPHISSTTRSPGRNRSRSRSAATRQQAAAGSTRYFVRSRMNANASTVAASSTTVTSRTNSLT